MSIIIIERMNDSMLIPSGASVVPSNLFLPFLNNHALNFGWRPFECTSLGCESNPGNFHEDFMGIWREKHSL